MAQHSVACAKIVEIAAAKATLQQEKFSIESEFCIKIK